MKLAVSQIAWQSEVDVIAAEVLKDFGVKYLETTPFITKDTQGFLEFWSQRGISPVAYQGVFYKQPVWSIFNPKDHDALLLHLDQVMQQAQQLGINKLVFGSPKSRVVSDQLTPELVDKLAVDFFTSLGQLAERHRVVICLEPIPKVYGCNFLNTASEVIQFLRSLNHPNIRLNLDFGAALINQESLIDVIQQAGSLVHHVHVSLPNLKPVSKLDDHHAKAIQALLKIGYQGFCSIEMMSATTSQESILQLKQTLSLLSKIYD